MSDTTHLEGRTDSLPRVSAVRRFLQSTAGSVLPMSAAGIFVLAGLVGAGLDMALAFKAERRLQAGCDAGVLAGRRAVGTNGFDTAAKAEAIKYFNANYNPEEQGTAEFEFKPLSNDDGNTVEATATAALPTLLMSVFGFESHDLGVVCSASMGIGNSDIMFVLDNTGSMAWEPDGSSASRWEDTRIFALQEAMRDFYDTVQDSVEGSNSRVRYGFVPYSSTVRVGQLIHDLDPDYLADSITVSSIGFANFSGSPIRTWTSSFTYSSASYGGWSHHWTTRYSSSTSCNNARPDDTSWADYGSATTDSVSYRVEDDTGHQIKTTGIHQDQRFTDYSCRQTSGYWYVDKRTGTREKRSSIYEERVPVAVNSNNATFANAILQQRTFNTSSYKNFQSVTLPIGINTSASPDRIVNVTSRWDGCIMERQTVTDASFSFVSLLTGITPSGAMDLNIDAAPTNAATEWAPLWHEVSYFRDEEDYLFDDLDDDEPGESGYQSIQNSEVSDNKAATACPFEAREFAEMDEGDFNDYVDELTPIGGTYHDIGLLWGARLSSPTGLWADTVNDEPDNGGTVSRHMIFMTDGELDTDRWANSAYGMEFSDHRVTGTGTSDSAQLSRHRSRYLAICEAIKARGIRLWVIAFGSGVTLSDELDGNDGDGCSSPDSAFRATQADDLHETFQEIAKQVGELRVTQ